MTKLILYRRFEDGGQEHRYVLVPTCPMFDFNDRNDTEEVRALLADGFHIAGHVDGVDHL